MRFYVNDACVGCGLCTVICPEVFFMNDDGLAEAVEDRISDEHFQEAESALESCPAGAITRE